MKRNFYSLILFLFLFLFFALFSVISLKYLFNSSKKNINSVIKYENSNYVNIIKVVDEVDVSEYGEVDYLGKKETIERFSKPLPERQYDITDTYPNSKASVLFTDPETPLLYVEPKMPDENERLKIWLEQWDNIKKSQKLAKKYYKSFKKTKNINYIELAAEVQNKSISDLLDLQQGSWPNSDYAFRAYKKKVLSCKILDEWAVNAHLEGLTIVKSDPKICDIFP